MAGCPLDRKELLLPLDPIWIVTLVGRSEGSVGQMLISLFFTVTVAERIYSKHAVRKGKYLDSDSAP